MRPARAIRRVVLALEPGASAEEGAVEAVSLAGQLGAPLLVVYGVDEDLRRLGALPARMTRHVSAGRAGALDPGSMASELKASAARARHAVEDAARSSGVTYLFQELTMALPEALPGLVLETDLVVFQRHATGVAGLPWLRERGLLALWRLGAPLLLLDGPPRPAPRGPLDRVLERSAPLLRRAALAALLEEGARAELVAGLIVVRREELGEPEPARIRALATGGMVVLVL